MTDLAALSVGQLVLSDGPGVKEEVKRRLAQEESLVGVFKRQVANMAPVLGGVATLVGVMAKRLVGNDGCGPDSLGFEEGLFWGCLVGVSLWAGARFEQMGKDSFEDLQGLREKEKDLSYVQV